MHIHVLARKVFIYSKLRITEHFSGEQKSVLLSEVFSYPVFSYEQFSRFALPKMFSYPECCLMNNFLRSALPKCSLIRGVVLWTIFRVLPCRLVLLFGVLSRLGFVIKSLKECLLNWCFSRSMLPKNVC